MSSTAASPAGSAIAPRRSAAASASGETSTATTRAPSGARHDDRGESDAAAAVHGHPLALPDGGPRDDRPVGGREAASERRGFGESERVGQRDEVEIGLEHDDELGERPPQR